MKTYLDYTIGSSFFSRGNSTQISRYVDKVVNSTVSTPYTAAMLLYSLAYSSLGSMDNGVRKRYLEALGVVFDTETVSFDSTKVIGKNKILILYTLENKFLVDKNKLIHKLVGYSS